MFQIARLDLVSAASLAEHEELTEGNEQALFHLAGYLAHSVAKKHKCKYCCNLLINNEASHELAEVELQEDKVAEVPGQNAVVAPK